eukprot:11882708-Karenia_brevis.AAC.1
MVKHSIKANMTNGKFSTKDYLRILLMRYGRELRTHDGECFHYRTGVWRNLTEPSNLDMQNACTIAEGLYHSLADIVLSLIHI